MKILLLNQAFYPDRVATAQILLDIAQHLKSIGHEVSVVCDRRGYEKRGEIYKKFEEVDGIKVHRVNSTGFGRKSKLHRLIDFLTFEIALVSKLAFFRRQDVVVSFTSPPLIGVIGTFFCMLRGGRSVQWLMDVNPDMAIAVGYLKKTSLLGRTLTALFRFSLKQSDQVVVLDRFMKERIEAHGIEPSRITIVPPWQVYETAGDRTALADPVNQFRMKHGLDGKFVVLYSGNHSLVHPLDTVIDAAIEMRNDDDVRFVFIGGGVRVKDVQKAVKQFNLKNVVQLPPQPRETLASSLACADLHLVVMGDSVSGLVHTSKIYGILASGKPYVFVGPSRSHVADVLAECPYGFQVQHGEVEALLRIIAKARKLHPTELDEYHEKNRSYVRKNYAPKRLLSVFSNSLEFNS